VIATALKLEKVERNLTEGCHKKISIKVEENAATFDVDFELGRIAVFSARPARVNITIYDLKDLNYVDELEFMHFCNSSISILKLTADWVIRSVKAADFPTVWLWSWGVKFTRRGWCHEKLMRGISF
jgi:hypothetical protein